MLNGIKNKIEKELRGYLAAAPKLRQLAGISPLLASKLKDFLCRPGKRLRPVLFVLSYFAFAKKTRPGIFKSALSIELLHDFMLIHDDIIDRSPLRRGKPAMHTMLNDYLAPYKGLKFNGEDLSIVAGDIVYALAMEAFLALKEEPRRKEKALRGFIDAAFYTGCGEFIELISGSKSLEETSKNDIYRIYDLKTAYYTFAFPLSIGATLAGARPGQVKKVFKYGLYLGRAFQIKDDILGIFADESRIGKSTLTDLQEAKKTLLIWYAFRHAGRREKLKLKNIFGKKKVSRNDLFRARKILLLCGAKEYAQKEILGYLRKARALNACCAMRAKYKNLLLEYSKEVLSL